ncbi:MAG: ABC transporter substrate-binding protein [Candidatus Aerophobetes bacterium]|nr:ABC transporter substrate-binding protein [Candidatus Aerophobetes bacterium]
MQRRAKILIALGLIIAVAVVVISVWLIIPRVRRKVVRIGITQIVDHPALNAVRDGFIEVMADNGYGEGENVTYDIQNAQGDMATASTIAHKFVSDKVDLILSIATPTSQAAVNATTTIPIVFSAVTDPVGAGLVKSLENSGNNVTGMSDLTPVQRQFELIKTILPKAKAVGTLYNAAEANSVLTNELAKEACKKLGLGLVEATVSSSADVFLAAQSLVGRCDAIYVSTDNTTVSALDAVVQVTNKNNIPLVLADPTTVNKGALLALGFDYYDHGRETAPIAIKVLKGTKPSDIPVKFAKELELWVNLNIATQIGFPPSSLLDTCKAFAGELKGEGVKVDVKVIGE